MPRVERTFAGRRLVIETGRMAKQAAGSAVVTFGETMVLAAVTVSDNISSLPFFPLTVEYKERTYAAGKIPGGFIKREGRPQDGEILSARIIDRSIRPLFPEGFKNEIQVFIYVISADQQNDADVLALLATSVAINSSKIPFLGPIGGCACGPPRGQVGAQPHVPAARLHRHRSRGRGQSRLAAHGRGRSTRGERGRGRRCAAGGTRWDPRVDRRPRGAAEATARGRQDGVDQAHDSARPRGAGARDRAVRDPRRDQRQGQGVARAGGREGEEVDR